MWYCSQECNHPPCVGWCVDEGEEDSDWEDVDEEMEGIVTDVEETMVSDLPEPSVHQHLALTLLCDRSLHHKVRRGWQALSMDFLPHPLYSCSAGVFRNFQ